MSLDEIKFIIIIIIIISNTNFLFILLIEKAYFTCIHGQIPSVCYQFVNPFPVYYARREHFEV